MHPLSKMGSHPGIITSLLVFGDTLVSTCDEGRMKVWNLKHSSLIGRKHRNKFQTNAINDENDEEGSIVLMELSLGKGIQPTVLMHPDTYLNKVLIGFSDGTLSLWNIRSGKLVHQFKSILPSADEVNSPQLNNNGVTSIEQSPALDVVAVGMNNGMIHLIHLKQDVVLFELNSGKTSVTSLSFRTDNTTSQDNGDESSPTMISGCSDGKLWVWDLKGKKLIGEVGAPLGAHDGKILSASFLPQEPVCLYIDINN